MNEIRKEIPSEVEVEIADLSRGGSGVARLPSGQVIFVPMSAPGDLLRVRIVKEHKHYCQAEILEIVRPSPLRQKPPCPVFGRCGGCEWQHLPYELQWKTKAEGVRHALGRVQITLDSPEQWREFPAERIWNYRNRIQLRGDGQEIGYYAAGSHRLVPANHCPIARPELNAVWEQLRAEGARLPRPYKVEVAVKPDGGIEKVWNAPHGAAGFRQIHDEQNAKLQRWVKEVLAPGRRLMDLYGGAGNLSLGLAGSMKEIHCVDVGAPSVPPPGTPAEFKFHRSQVLLWLLRLAQRKPAGAEWSAIVDPPRVGLAEDFVEIAAAFEKLGVTELVAVGCEPDPWARDLSRFARKGWRVVSAAVFDFFPQTHHVESAALLKKD